MLHDPMGDPSEPGEANCDTNQTKSAMCDVLLAEGCGVAA